MSQEFHEIVEQSRISSRMNTILAEVEREKNVDFFRQFGYFLVVFACSILVGSFLFAFFGPLFFSDGDYSGFLFAAVSPFLLCGFIILVGLVYLVFFWPVIFFIWAFVHGERQRRLISIVLTSLENRVPLAPLLRAFAYTCFFPHFRGRVLRFSERLEQGLSFRKTLGEVPGILRYDIVAMLDIKADDPETYKTIDQILHEEQNLSVLQSNSFFRIGYLIIVSFIFANVLRFMQFFILPKFRDIFESFDTHLPGITTLVFTFWSGLLGVLGILFLLLMFGLGIFFLLQLDVISARPRGFRRLFRNVDSARFLRILGTGLRRNLSLPQSLEIYCNTASGRFLRTRGQRIREEIEKGKAWISVLRKESLIDAKESELIRSAEQTGNLPHVLNELASSKNQAQIQKADFISQIVFFPSILILGAFVGTFIIACFLPIVQLVRDMCVF